MKFTDMLGVEVSVGSIIVYGKSNRNNPINIGKVISFEGDFIRSALRTGLTIEQQFGANPYRFGVIGSTDSHTGLATAEEPNFWGKMATDSTPQSKSRDSGHIEKLGWAMSASGLAAVWAEDNSRESIFAAFKRREVYATTGPRMVLRLFAGHDFADSDWDGDWVRAGYARGVPMGGDLVDRGRAPVFLVSALKDPEGANLDRIQIVKGWVDANGVARERIYDLAWSDMAGTRRRVGGAIPAVGDTVVRREASYTNTIGAPELRATWRDPDYRSGQRAFYYVRAIEIPTPSWVLFDARRFGFDLPPEVVEANVIQERAYSSPVWLRPRRGPGDATAGRGLQALPPDGDEKANRGIV